MKKSLLLIFILSLIALYSYFSTQENPTKVVTVESSSLPEVIINSKPKLPITEHEWPQFEEGLKNTDVLDTNVQKILGLNSELSLRARNQLVSSSKVPLSNRSGPESYSAFLNSKDAEDKGSLAFHSLKNDLLVYVIEDGRLKDQTGSLLSNLLLDENQHEIMKEYVLQYIPDFFERHWVAFRHKKNKQENSNLSIDDENLQNQLINNLWQQIPSRQGPISEQHSLAFIDYLEPGLKSIKKELMLRPKGL